MGSQRVGHDWVTFTFNQMILRSFHTEILQAPQVYLVFIQIPVLSSQPLYPSILLILWKYMIPLSTEHPCLVNQAASRSYQVILLQKDSSSLPSSLFSLSLPHSEAPDLFTASCSNFSSLHLQSCPTQAIPYYPIRVAFLKHKFDDIIVFMCQTARSFLCLLDGKLSAWNSQVLTHSFHPVSTSGIITISLHLEPYHLVRVDG